MEVNRILAKNSGESTHPRYEYGFAIKKRTIPMLS